VFAWQQRVYCCVIEHWFDDHSMCGGTCAARFYEQAQYLFHCASTIGCLVEPLKLSRLCSHSYFSHLQGNGRSGHKEGVKAAHLYEDCAGAITAVT
jgi:hypothetical protein